MTDPEKESEKQQGLSKEAWTAIGAIAVALIGGIVTLVNPLVNKQDPPSPPSPTRSLESVTSPSPPLGSSPVPTVLPSTPLPARRLAQILDSVNIDFSDSALRDQLGNSYSEYPQFAEGCLKLLDNQRLKKKVYFDVIFWNYTEELGGKVTSNSLDGNLDASRLKTAMVRAYNTRNGSSTPSFKDIVEPTQ